MLLLMIILITSVASAQTYKIDWYVIGSGGGHMESVTYQVDGTAGQPIVGISSSDSLRVESGFWVGAGAVPSEGYEYLPGDANMYNGLWPPQVIGADVTYLVNYFRGSVDACLVSGFFCSGDANGDCLVIGSDVTRMVTYFRGLIGISYCVDFEPAWHDPSELPPFAPSGWPNCETPPAVAGMDKQPD